LVWTAGEIARQAQIDATTLMRELVWLVVMPILLGQLVRSIPAIAQGASKHKLMLGTLAQCGILLMVFLAAIKTGGRLAGSPQSAAGTLEFAVMIASVSGLHLALFFAGMSVARWLRLPREDQLAVGFCGSQKTLMVGLKVADDCGFSILPMICSHVLQLFIDTLLAERLRPQNNGRDKAD
jgi:sodium/bile acid cotransporter 7